MRFVPIDTKKDRDYIIPFRRDSFVVSFGTDEGFADEGEYLDWVKARSSEFPDGFVIVWEDEIPIGQIELTIREYEGKTIGYINLYYLIPEKRGLGLGKELHEYALKLFRIHGVSEYHLRVSPTNQYALSFYYKNGMKKIGSEHGGKVIRMKGIVDMGYEFRELTIENLEELIERYISYYNSENGKWTYDLAKRRLGQIFMTPDFYGIGLYSGSEMLGFAIGWFKQFDDIQLFYLEEILVFKEYQNKGFGSIILKELESLVKRLGAQKINLLTTYGDKHQKFYSRLGYEKSDFLIPMIKKI